MQVQVVDQTTHLPKCHSFVGLDIGESAPVPCCEIWNSKGTAEKGRKFYGFTSIQTFHTHTHRQAGFATKARAVKWRWGWQGGENEMKMKMEWRLLNRDTRRGTQKKRRGEGENTTPTHLVQSGQTLKRQGKRKAEADGNKPRPAEGGEGRTRLNKPTPAKPKPT